METEVEEQLEKLNVGSTDVIFLQYRKGAGKIIISNDDWEINTSNYWGAIGGDGLLKSFILELNPDYFVTKLGVHNHTEINIKATMANVRKSIKEDYRFTWWMDLEYNKTLRQELRNIQEYCEDQQQFVNMMCALDDCYWLEPQHCKGYEYEAKSLIGGLTCEPWHYIVKGKHKTNVWLEKFLPKLKEAIRETL